MQRGEQAASQNKKFLFFSTVQVLCTEADLSRVIKIILRVQIYNLNGLFISLHLHVCLEAFNHRIIYCNMSQVQKQLNLTLTKMMHLIPVIFIA